MSNILFAVLAVGVIGALAGLLLTIASTIVAVPVDERTNRLVKVLPGVNCGACGYSSCADYAAALSNGEADVGLCTVEGRIVAEKCAAILEIDTGDVVPKAAVVRCLGICDNTFVKMDYTGFESCAAAAQFYGGINACRFGCIGLGDCARECDYHAIELCNEIAIVDRDICMGCGKCAKVCPKQLIEITQRRQAAQVMCSNRERGAVTRMNCKVGCIGCMKCEQVCPAGAVKIQDFLARVDRDICTGCGICIDECPTGAIQKII